MDRRARILEVIRAAAQKNVTPAPDESLFDSGVLDSFALPEMVSALEREFGITIPDSDLSPRKFESIARIEAYLENKN